MGGLELYCNFLSKTPTDIRTLGVNNAILTHR